MNEAKNTMYLKGMKKYFMEELIFFNCTMDILK